MKRNQETILEGGMMHLRFNFERTLQASAYLLRLDGKRMSYLCLLKLLYIADREWLAESGESISGDRAFAMRFGPVLTSVYDLIRGNGSKAGLWDDFIHTEGYAVNLVTDPGRDELSKAIVKKLAEVTERYRNVDEFELSELTHSFPEWANHYNGGTNSIPWQEMILAQNKPEMVVVVERDEKARQVFDEVFGTDP
jgi:uncharacterized phage-associated protein